MNWRAKTNGNGVGVRSLYPGATLRKHRGMGVALLLAFLFVPRAVYSQNSLMEDQQISSELAAMHKQGDVIARVREQTLGILQSENSCSAWFGEVDADTANVFRSLHYEIKEDMGSQVMHRKNGLGGGSYKHPWGASSIENGGPNSIVELNLNGPFFRSTSRVIELWPGEISGWPKGMRRLSVGSFGGNTTEARITLMLHELGHIVGRLPLDDGSWDGSSSRNTEEVERHCKHQIRAAADGI